MAVSEPTTAVEKISDQSAEEAHPSADVTADTSSAGNEKDVEEVGAFEDAVADVVA